MSQIHLHGCKIIPPHFLSALFGLIYRPRDFASYMLGIFIGNLLLYLAFYIIMKVSEAAGSRSTWARGWRCRQLRSLCFSPAAPQLREGPPHPALLHRGHRSGVGRCPVFFLPESQQLGGKRSLVFFQGVVSLHLSSDHLASLSLCASCCLSFLYPLKQKLSLKTLISTHKCSTNGTLSSLSG